MWILIIKPQPSRTYWEMVRNGFNSWSDSAERDWLLSVDLETLRHYGRPIQNTLRPGNLLDYGFAEPRSVAYQLAIELLRRRPMLQLPGKHSIWDWFWTGSSRRF
jgi:hypothetical protein